MRTSIHAAVWGADWSPQGITPALAGAASLGYDHVVVPLRRFDDIQPAALARAFAQERLSPLNTCGLSADKDIGDADAQVRARGIAHLQHAVALARDMGSSQIGGVLYGPIHKAAGPLPETAFRRAAESMHAVASHAAQAGVRIALEVVNRYETPLLYNTRRGLEFLTAVAHPNVFLHLDTFHMSIDESAPFDMIEAALPHLAYLELDQSHRGDAFEGSLDLAAWARRAADLGYDGIVGVEAFSRQLLAPDHADALAVWEDRFTHGQTVASNFMQVIRSGFAR
ncbi:sugar phosphate isomerase/epimerase family protein [Variovorax guangxiensis]|uniref:Sugar phosphate isomerase/epimerase n=1 Tax=Variovorax guangxiensis TaxID=1775474 RepID=A0A502DFK9_9BURK|nr:sugar phosphate isomerase/epimerase family protein [Variovorax guangxiensis]TPG23492.1 sugar phosphate isomerase/epimerase [Variovorax guangxiensis]TPG24049.1 sugar phosphate isomerase/epimerase [Variovorax ginsengisoli]